MNAASRARRAVKELKVSCLGLLHCATVQVPLAHGVDLAIVNTILLFSKTLHKNSLIFHTKNTTSGNPYFVHHIFTLFVFAVEKT